MGDADDPGAGGSRGRPRAAGCGPGRDGARPRHLGTGARGPGATAPPAEPLVVIGPLLNAVSGIVHVATLAAGAVLVAGRVGLLAR